MAIILAFLKDQNSIYFGTTHLLMRKDARKQLELQVTEGSCYARILPGEQTTFATYIKSKFNDINRNRDIKLISVHKDLGNLEVNSMLSK